MESANVARVRPWALKGLAMFGYSFFFVDFLAACLIGHDKPSARAAKGGRKYSRSCGMYG